MRPTHSFMFFNFIRYTFGHFCASLLKDWIKHKRIFFKNKLRLKFCKFCIHNNIVPPHLYKLHNVKLDLKDNISKSKFNTLKDSYIQKLLKLELSDTYRSINYSQITLFKLVRKINSNLPVSISNAFFTKQNSCLYFNFINEQKRLNKKMSWLVSKKRNSDLEKIQQVQYFWKDLKMQSNTNPTAKHHSFALSPHRNFSDGNVKLHPSYFINSQLPPSISSIREKWFTNLSSKPIPNNVQFLIQLGDNFSLPTSNKEKITKEIIKSVECNIKKFPKTMHNNIRNRSISIINKLTSFSPHKNSIDGYLMTLKKHTQHFLRDNDNIILTRADKGNITVALDRNNYINKINEMLSDNNTYMKVKKDPTKRIIDNLRRILTAWKNSEYISISTHKTLISSDGLLPRAYGLPKVHKENCPFRIIVSSVDSPLYALATFLQKTMSNSIPLPQSHIGNSFELVEKLKNIHIEDKFSLISLDVISLFTNIPIDSAINSITDRWDFISTSCNIPKDEFLRAVRFVLESTYFSFDNQIYKQNFGTPMGSPLSPMIADIVMQDLERVVLETFDFDIPFYYRYVDDIVLAVPTSKIDSVFKKFNSIHPKLQFTIEIGNNSINFLDVTIIIKDNQILFDWFHKPTFSGRYLNYWSQHPLSQKKGTIIGLVDRAFLLSHPEFHQKNFESIIKILLENDYPLDFIFNTISVRIKSLVNDKIAKYKNNNTENGSNKKIWFTVPFIKTISEKFKSITNGSISRLSFFSMNKLNSLIKVHKDPLPKPSYMNVVYKISCRNCDASYVGQTCRQLKTRISEHKKHISRNTTTHSVITEHRLQFGHDFDWEGVEILDAERNFNKRLISEMINIKSQKNGINLQTDTEALDRAYFSYFNNA